MANATHAGFLGRSELGSKHACPPRRPVRGPSPTPGPPPAPRNDKNEGQGGPPRGFIRAALILSGLFLVAVLVWPKHDDPKDAPGAAGGTETNVDGPRTSTPIGFVVGIGVASVRGTITETNGAPLPTATVCARQMSDTTGQDSTMTPRCTTAGIDGNYALVDLPPGRWIVSATAPGHLPLTHELAGGIQEMLLAADDQRLDVDLALALGGARIDGRVVDDHGAPIVGATVTFNMNSADLVVTTDEQGSFVGDVDASTVNIAAEHAGYADAIVDSVAPSSLRIVMVHETVLAGRVVDAATQLPVAGARVRPDAAEGMSCAANAESALTDADGRFRIEGLPSGRYRPFAEAIGAKGRVAESFVLGLGESATELVIAVSPAHHVQGRLMLDGKTACAEGWVSLTETSSVGDGDWRRIDSAGSVLFPAVDDASYEMTLECDGIESIPKAPLVVDRDLDGLVWSVPRGLAIKGIVVDVAGKPVANASVSANARDATPDDDGNSAYTNTASDGTFTLAGLHAATYDVAADGDAQASGKEPLALTVSAGRDLEGVRLVLRQGGIIDGVIVDTSGSPVVAARVQAGGSSSARVASTDAQGKFRLVGVGEGKVWLVVTSDSGRTLSNRKPASELAIVDGQTVSTRLVVQRLEGFIRGRVVDAAGQPVAGAFVDADRSDYSPRLDSLSSETSVITDAKGMFVITGLEEGPQSIRARMGAKEATQVDVALGSDLTLKLVGGSLVEGTVAFVDGQVPARFTVSLTSGYASLREEFVGTGGRFSFRAVPPGEASVTVNAAQGQGHSPLTLTSDGAATVAVTLSPFRTVRGRVVDAEGRPVPHVNVSLDASHAYGATDDRGEFVLKQVFGDTLELELYTDTEPFGHAKVTRPMGASSSAPIDVGDIVLEAGGSLDGIDPVGTEAMPPLTSGADELPQNGPPPSEGPEQDD